MNFVRLSHDRVTFDVDRDASTATLQIFIRRWDCLRVAICSTLVRCYRCISILIIIPVVRWCSLIGPHKSAVVCLIVGIQASGMSIPLSLLMLLGWSLIWIASLTLLVYQWGSRSIILTLLQIGICPVSLSCSETAEVWVRENRMSLSRQTEMNSQTEKPNFFCTETEFKTAKLRPKGATSEYPATHLHVIE